MNNELKVILHSIAEDGLPDMTQLTGMVAFIWDGCVVSGWPIEAESGQYIDCWEPSEDRFGGPVRGVTHWLEFPKPFWRLE